MTRTRPCGRAHGLLRQSYWVPEVTGTALATFTAAGSATLAVTATGWAHRLPRAMAVLSAALVMALVRTRPRRWRRELAS